MDINKKIKSNQQRKRMLFKIIVSQSNPAQQSGSLWELAPNAVILKEFSAKITHISDCQVLRL